MEFGDAGGFDEQVVKAGTSCAKRGDFFQQVVTEGAANTGRWTSQQVFPQCDSIQHHPSR